MKCRVCTGTMEGNNTKKIMRLGCRRCKINIKADGVNVDRGTTALEDETGMTEGICGYRLVVHKVINLAIGHRAVGHRALNFPNKLMY